MARFVFYSFHYEKDISRVMPVRNSWVTKKNQTASGVIDSADFENIKKQGEQAVRNWIVEQLSGTSVTVVLIGSETLERPYVQYEIEQSLKRGNGIIGVHINNIKDFTSSTTQKGNINIPIKKDGSQINFNSIAQIYDYTQDNGYENLETWVEKVASEKGK